MPCVGVRAVAARRSFSVNRLVSRGSARADLWINSHYHGREVFPSPLSTHHSAPLLTATVDELYPFTVHRPDRILLLRPDRFARRFRREKNNILGYDGYPTHRARQRFGVIVATLTRSARTRQRNPFRAGKIRFFPFSYQARNSIR